MNLILIGTLHAHLTPASELTEILEKYLPDMLLVEIDNDDLLSKNLSTYPPEMIAAYKWAAWKGVDVRGFDSKIDVLAEGLTEADNKKAIELQERMIAKLTWKDFNKEENSKKLEINWLTDPDKVRDREKEMISNIIKVLPNKGTVVIVTGCSHLKYIKKNFPKAVIPLAN